MHDPFLIHSRRRIPGSSIVLAVIAALCLTAAIADQSAVPLSIFTGLIVAAIYAFLIQPPSMKIKCDAEGVQVEGRIHPTPYSAIDGLTINGEPRNSASALKKGRIEISHPEGKIIIGKSSTPNSPEIFEFFLEKITPSSRPDLLPPTLRSFYDEQANMFGAERVWAFGARRFFPRQHQAAKALHYGVCLIIISLVSLLAAALLGADTKAVAPLSIGTGIVAVIALLIGFASYHGASSASRKRTAGLVIAPQGIALTQGVVSGKQAWEALNGTTYLDQGRRTGIQLLIPGTNLIIADIFSSPLQQIDPLIKAYLGK